MFQGITLLMQQGGDAQAVYARAFGRIPGLIDGSDPDIAQIDGSLDPLREGLDLVQTGKIVRQEIDARLTQYIIPLAIAGDDARSSYVPEFNEAISPNALLWPQVRSCWDAERVCLVSVERKTGWFHDLWFPGDLWADTEGRWQVPGFTYHDGMSSYDIQNEPLIAAFEELQRQERTLGRWAIGGTLLPCGDKLQERFPLVGRFLGEKGEASTSELSPNQVASQLKGVFH